MSNPVKSSEFVLILDFGSQYTQLIARRCRELKVYSRIESWDFPLDDIKKSAPVGIILSGGPRSTYEENAPSREVELYNLGIPILGVCYGMQLMVLAAGGKVEYSPSGEYGRAQIQPRPESRLFSQVEADSQVWMSHRDHVSELPEEWIAGGISDAGIIAAVENPARRLYGTQFHPEVSHTQYGIQILKNFLFEICGASGDWDMSQFAQQMIDELREQIGDQKVICAFSGGIDSSVAATLVHRAIGDNLKCVLVDNGLLRKKEAEKIRSVFKPLFGENLIVVNAGKQFLSDLKGVTDPEQKRKLIGRRFIDVFTHEAGKFSNAKYLLQGTLYPDVIESSVSTGPAAVIKTHHNVGGLPEELGLDLVEPLRFLFKDEVRKIGVELGLPDSVIKRHPFPGPGLAVRILGEVDQQSVELLQEADSIFIEELRRTGWYDKVSQALAVLLPLHAVGVMGDERTYDKVIALRSVNTTDFMTADFSPLPLEILGRIASLITSRIKGINRVVYDITSKPPGTVEWE